MLIYKHFFKFLIKHITSSFDWSSRSSVKEHTLIIIFALRTQFLYFIYI